MYDANQGKTPDYVKKSIKDYQRRNKRVQIFVPFALYKKFEENYSSSLSFNAYVKGLLEQSFASMKNIDKYAENIPDEWFGQLPASMINDPVEKNCIFPKEYEQRVLDKYIELMGQQASILRGGGKGSGFSFVSYLQWLVAKSLETDFYSKDKINICITTQNKTPDYVKKSIRDYQHRNKRVRLFVSIVLYKRFEENYSSSLSFNAYVKGLLEQSFTVMKNTDNCAEAASDDLFGQLPTSMINDPVEKNCIFPKEYEQRVLDKYVELAGPQASVKKGRGKAPGFSFISYLQWLVAEDLKRTMQ